MKSSMHTQMQVEEAALESPERMRKKAEEMAAVWAGAIVQQAPENARAAPQVPIESGMTPPAAPQKPANSCTFFGRVAPGDYGPLSPTAPPIESV